LLHAGIDLQQRTSRLLLRLELGIEGPVVDLARFTERMLDRADYRRLSEAGMTTHEAIAGADDSVLLPLIGNDAKKLAAVRQAAEKWQRVRPPAQPAPALPAYH
jgi:hypothetical protein